MRLRNYPHEPVEKGEAEDLSYDILSLDIGSAIDGTGPA